MVTKKSKQKWSDEEVAIVRCLYVTSISVEAIARAVEKSPGAVKAMAHKFNLQRNAVPIPLPAKKELPPGWFKTTCMSCGHDFIAKYKGNHLCKKCR
jgi:hypothetical protein